MWLCIPLLLLCACARYVRAVDADLDDAGMSLEQQMKELLLNQETKNYKKDLDEVDFMLKMGTSAQKKKAKKKTLNGAKVSDKL